jgi:hypothetical protein
MARNFKTPSHCGTVFSDSEGDRHMRALLIVAAAFALVLGSAHAACPGLNYDCSDPLICTCEPDAGGGSGSGDCKNLGGAGKCNGEIHCWCGWAVCTCACWKRFGAAAIGTQQPTRYTPVKPGLLEGGGTLQPGGPAPTGTPTAPPRPPGGGGVILR